MCVGMALSPSPDEEQPAGNAVARFEATDDDEADTDNSLISYSIVSILPIPASAAAVSVQASIESTHSLHSTLVRSSTAAIRSQ